MHDVSGCVDRMNTPADDVACRVLRLNASKRGPRPDVVPAEITGDDTNLRAALENSMINRDWCHSLEESLELTVASSSKSGRHLRSKSSHFIEKITDAPHEDAGIPQVTLMQHPLCSLAVGLLYEPPHFTCSTFGFISRLDIAESGIRSRRHDSDGYQ